MATRAELEARIAGLQDRTCALETARGEFAHDLRRVRDGLERAGGRERALEARARGLEENLAQTSADLSAVSAEIDALKLRLIATR